MPGLELLFELGQFINCGVRSILPHNNQIIVFLGKDKDEFRIEITRQHHKMIIIYQSENGRSAIYILPDIRNRKNIDEFEQLGISLTGTCFMEMIRRRC